MKGKTLLEILNEVGEVTKHDICSWFCEEVTHPCESKNACSWFELFNKKQFIEVGEGKAEK